MKMTTRIIAAVMLLALCLSGLAALAEDVTTTGNVYLRKGAGRSFDAITVIPKGTKLSYSAAPVPDERGVKWYQVTYKGKTGWVSSKYAKASGSSSSEKKLVATGNVYVRAGAGLNYKKVAVMKKGQSATYLGTSKKDGRGVVWYQVKFNGKTGWVSSKYSKLK